MAKKKGSNGRTAKYTKAGPKRPPNMVSYRDSAGKRHWKVA